MAAVYRTITELGQGGGEMLDHLFHSIENAADPARLAYGIAALSQDRTRASILTTAAVHLRQFADPSIAALTAHGDYDLASIVDRPTVVYLLLPDDRSSRNAIAAMYLQQIYSALTRVATFAPNGRLPLPVYWVLDEFANIGRWRDFDKMLSVMAGRNMAAMIVLQALPQLAARYGDDLARIIQANCDTWLFLRTNDRITADEISKKCGSYTIRTRTGSTTSRRYDISTGASEQFAARPLLTPDEVLRWPMGQALVMQAGQYPARLPLADITAWPADFRPCGLPPVRSDPEQLPEPVVSTPAEAAEPQLTAGTPTAPATLLLWDDADREAG